MVTTLKKRFSRSPRRHRRGFLPMLHHLLHLILAGSLQHHSHQSSSSAFAAAPMFEIVGVKTRRINAAASSAISAASPRSRNNMGDGDKGGLLDTKIESCNSDNEDNVNDDEMKFILPHHHHSQSSNNSPSRPLGTNSRRRLLSSPISTISTWYMSQMHTHELRTKFVTSGILAVVGVYKTVCRM